MLLRSATRDDLPYILTLERKSFEQGFVGTDDLSVHESRLSDPDCRYFVLELDGKRAGYAILRGLASTNGSIELKRIVVAQPGRGTGRAALGEILDIAFQELLAHRLWLDVYEDNERARHLYRDMGFAEEGTMRECIRSASGYRSLVLMSLLEDEYSRGRPAAK
ncbi:MAG TPA: GNAT family N-acetyltransferase [Bryobacteraceae bacterium]|nr:GNAT family N-acetyltransferase [Bryobacteraceae bacterium]